MKGGVRERERSERMLSHCDGDLDSDNQDLRRKVWMIQVVRTPNNPEVVKARGDGCSHAVLFFLFTLLLL